MRLEGGSISNNCCMPFFSNHHQGSPWATYFLVKTIFAQGSKAFCYLYTCLWLPFCPHSQYEYDLHQGLIQDFFCRRGGLSKTMHDCKATCSSIGGIPT